MDNRLKQQAYPNTTHISEYFEVSRKTAQRDITYFRDRLRAPIAYHPANKGYYYTKEDFEFPHLPASQEEVLAILIARSLLSEAGGFISEAFRGFTRKLREATASFGMSEQRVVEAFSASWHAYSPAPERVFQKTVQALVEHRTIEIEYLSPKTGEHTRRIIEPHHLQHYMASWVLIAYCRLRNEWRKFYLSRIEELDVLGESFDIRPREQWAHQLEAAFGIFQGTPSIPITLCFNPFRSGWVREQVWHPAQTVRTLADGSIELTFSVADFREVKMKILQYGADVQVLEPDSLRDELRKEVDRLWKAYHPGENPGL
ncbi:MAG: WYL domain-containing protein [Syntrophobacteraceae bacterium]